MTDLMAHTLQKACHQTIHRRHFVKQDGRDLFLYGYKLHDLPSLPEDGGEVAKGGELRHHPLRDEWNIYAAHRQNRTFKPSAADNPLAPSVPGLPPTEIPFTDFELAVFENKFTSLHAHAPKPKAIEGLDLGTANGRCDVIVYGPKAEGNLHTLGQDKRRLLLAAWNDRYETLFDQGCEFILPFENRGDEVGVTLHHPHGQIYAFPFVPQVQQKAMDAFEQGYDLAADIKRYKADYGVAQAGGITAFCPPFTRFPFETWIAPDIKARGPWDFSEDQLDGFAGSAISLRTLSMISDRFKSVFDQTPQISGFTPGRVNLIGEHTDYNGGMVLPTALELGITFAIKPRSDNVIRISSDKFDDLAERLDKDIAVLARRVENEFIGMPCGIMDQMAVAIARPGQALALDTENLDYDLVDLPQDYHMAVIHSGQFRQLNEGRYKERKEECDAIKARLGHDNICQISDADFKSLHDMPDVLQRRARHCMSDHRRTIDAVACLRAHDMEEFGRLMNESHISMRDDFEITVPKVDDLVKDAVKFGALGARQTGGGFGGCIVACVPKTEVKTWTKSLLEHHPQAFWVS